MKLFFLLVFLSSSGVWAQHSPYFPATGAGAVAQDIRDINNPAVCLVIAAAPGLEDLSSIAYLRIGKGMQVAVAYITNGEEIPSDLNGETFYLLASRRKEEGYHALSYLGVESYFLNIPSNEFPIAEKSLRLTAALDHVFTGRLDSLISKVKPDVIILDRSPLLLNGESDGVSYIDSLIVKVIRSRVALHLWRVNRLYVEGGVSQNTVDFPVESRDEIWSKSYKTMAEEAQEHYESLKYQIRLWDRYQSHRYAQVYPAPGGPPKTKMKLSNHGLQAQVTGFYSERGSLEIGKKLKELLPVIRSITPIQRLNDRRKQLPMLHDAIAKVDAFISSYSGSLGQRDLRVLATWKLGLEKIRCAVLGIDIQYSVSDTVVTPIQLFFLKFGKLDKAFDNGTTQILFPGVIQKKWIVDESQKEFYDWKDSAQLRVLTPRSIPLNSAETPEGFQALQVRSPFTFIVVHRDPNPSYDFLWREDVPLIVSPYRSIQVLTPQVAMLHDTDVVVRIKSNVRDRSGGEFYVEDSMVTSPRERVELPGKNYVVTDTLPLEWKDAKLSAPRKVEILASRGIAVGSFVVHSFDVQGNVSKKIGIYSTIEGSPLKIALSRLGTVTEDLDTVSFSPQDLSECSAIVLDQFSVKELSRSMKRVEYLRSWVYSGGKVLVMPQYGMSLKSLWPEGSAEFRYFPIALASEKLLADSTESILNSPNHLNLDGFNAGDFPISFGEVTGCNTRDAKVLVASQDGAALVVEEHMGRGGIIYCALNLYPGFLALEDATYRLLANLLSE